MRGILRSLAAFCLGTTALTLPAFAATATWTPGTNDFNTAGNWSTNAVPGNTDNAAFDASSQTTVSIAGSASVNAFVFNAGAPAYVFNITAPSAATTVQIGDGLASSGIINNSANAPTFNVTGSGGNTADLIFKGTQSVSNAVVNINNGGQAEFYHAFTTTGAVINVNSGGTMLSLGSGDTLAGSKVIMAGGLLDTDTSANGLSLGSIEGTGTINLRNNTLTVGALNTDTTLAATVTGAQLNKIGTGTLTLTGSNTYNHGGVSVNGGAVVLGAAGSLSTDSLNVRGGSFVAAASTSINALSFDSGTVAAASGTILSFTNNVTFAGTGPLVFGSSTSTGTITLAGVGCCIPFSSTVEIAGGTVRDLTSPPSGGDGNGSLSFAAYMAPLFTVDAGATADFNDHSVRYSAQPSKGLNLRGAGQVVLGTSAAMEMQVRSTNFSGIISGAGKVTFLSNASAHVLTGANTYTGGTTINSGATLQIGNGGTSGSLAGNISDNGVLILNRADTFTLPGAVSGAGSVVQSGTGITVMTGAETYTGSTLADFGTLRLGAGATMTGSAPLTINHGTFDLNGMTATIGSLSGAGTFSTLAMGGGTLTINQTANTSFRSAFTGAGSLIFNGPGTLNIGGFNTGGNFSGNITVNSGTLGIDIGVGDASSSITINGGTLAVATQRTFSYGALSGSGGTLSMSSSLLTFASSTDSTFAGQIASDGAGQFTKAGTGTLTLTGNSTNQSAIVISEGTLQFGNGGTAGLLAGRNITNNARLIFNRSDNVTFAPGIFGPGTVVKAGSGTLTLSAINTYTGATSVNAGTLNVTGAIGNSSVSVASGATLSGSGKVGATSIASGGILAAGDSGAPGTLTIGGNLTMASGANYVDFITPTATGLVSASGTAVINGSATANFASGSYAIGRFTLMTATGGLSGTFASLNTSGLPLAFKARLSYDASNVYLNLDPNTLAPLLSNPTGNQSNVVKAIDTAVLGGATPPAGFQALYNLSGPALNSALDQISGLIGPNIVNSAGQSFQAFLSLTGQGGDGGGFAPGNAYGNAGAPHRAQLGAGEMRVWGAAYGGHVGLSADPVSGAASLSGTNVGMVGGVDVKVQDGLLLGATLGWGGQDFRSGNGTGTSEDFAIGIYGRHENGPLYVSAALGYGWHHIKTLRTVTVSGTDVLQGIQDATDFGGRLETGWHFALGKTYAVTPYAAFMGDSLESPRYGETAVSGASTFALSVAPHTDGMGRVEAGARLSHDFALGDGTLAADLQAAWAHQVKDAPLTQASFLGLSGSSFVVAGVRPARDAALLGASLEMRQRSGLFFGLRGETLQGNGTSMVEAMGDLGWRW